MTSTIKFDKYTIGIPNTCFIIAEAGVNHDGSLENAKKLVDAAAEAGADAVKFQTFTPEEVVTKDSMILGYQERNLGTKQTQQSMLKELALKFSDFITLKQHCDQRGILFLSAPHSSDALPVLNDLVPAFKIGSGDVTNLPFLRLVAKYGKPIILSTGLATLDEVDAAVNTIKQEGNEDIILLQCTTNYPCPPEDVNLRVMNTLREKYSVPIGYSDHTKGILTSVAAAILGACVIEKHFTLDRTLKGPDHSASLEPQEFKEMVNQIRSIPTLLGSATKQPTKSETPMIPLIRKSIVAAKDLHEGERITEDMLAIKRPGNGIQPSMLISILGKTLTRDIPHDTLLSEKDFK